VLYDKKLYREKFDNGIFHDIDTYIHRETRAGKFFFGLLVIA